MLSCDVREDKSTTAIYKNFKFEMTPLRWLQPLKQKIHHLVKCQGSTEFPECKFRSFGKSAMAQNWKSEGLVGKLDALKLAGRREPCNKSYT